MGHADEKATSGWENDDRLATLTPHELDIVSGLKNRDVADRLFISETIVRHHLTSIFTKLDVHGRYELLRFVSEWPCGRACQKIISFAVESARSEHGRFAPQE